jgi:pSer/pThr/pTyr-binding forkhead associated (FHA) protein
VPDGSVSRQQCRIYVDGAAAVENLSSSNITRLNGEPLYDPASLKAGDELRCGRVTLVVDSLQSAGYSGMDDLNRGTVFINV